jgi:broad specificity phosphatase PhoE
VRSFRLLAVLATVAAPVAPAAGAQTAPAPPLVIVVRHAEKAAVPGDDPPLSAVGEARARALAAALRDAGVTTILTTQWKRTGATAAPLAAAAGITPTVVGTGGADVARHAADVAAAARRAGGTVLVVGHSNTVGPIVAALGGPAGVRLCDAQYATLHTVVPAAGGRARLVRSAYGASDPELDDRCAVVSPAR